MLERSMNSVVEHQPYSVSDEVQELHGELIVGDWHADSTLWDRDLGQQGALGHADIPRLQQGNVALQMFTTVTKSPVGLNYLDNDVEASDNIKRLALLQQWPKKTWNSLTERAIFQAQKLRSIAEQKQTNFRLISSQAELSAFLKDRLTNAKLLGGLLGTEGSHALDGKLENIQKLYDHGFRMMGLQHFFDNKLGGSLHSSQRLGLTEFGRQAVIEMQSMNIIVDVSHSSEQVVRDVLLVSKKPLVVSHTGFKGHCDSPRNISDELMQSIAKQGGLIAVGFWDGAICDTRPSSVADAIVYGIDLVGVNNLALGSDFDGGVTTAFDASELVVVTQALKDAGLSKTQIRKVMGGNMLRFLEKNLPE